MNLISSSKKSSVVNTFLLYLFNIFAWDALAQTTAYDFFIIFQSRFKMEDIEPEYSFEHLLEVQRFFVSGQTPTKKWLLNEKKVIIQTLQ